MSRPVNTRRLCIIALTVALMLPAAPLFADDDRWQMPDPGAWLTDLVQQLVDLVVDKSGEGDEPPGPEDPPNSGDTPGDEVGMFIEPNG